MASGTRSRVPKRTSDGAPMFNVPSSLLYITGGTFNHFGGTVNDSRKVIQKAFRNHIAPDASHDTNTVVDPPRCHPNTRTVILRRLGDWARNPTTDSLILWLFGPAGAGKTAIARSLAELLDEESLLAASFFFFRTAAKRNNEKLLISTLAYQMTRSVPEIEPYIAAIIEEDPFVFQQSLRTQLRKFIVDPVIAMSSMIESAPSTSKIIIIDGLDECSTPEAQSLILTNISEILPFVAGRLKFLVLSRPEYHVETTFNQSPLKRFTIFIDLKHDLTSYDDIRIFLIEKFDEIKRTHPLKFHIDPSWPGERAIEELVRRSSGNFIYPRTVMRYIETTYDRPQRRLKVILELLPTSDAPYAELDDLYRHILSHVRLDRVSLLKMLGVLVLCKGHYLRTAFLIPAMHVPESTIIETLLQVEPGDLLLRLIDLRSLIAFEEDSLVGGLSDLKFMHTSFPDFLLDSTRSGEFGVELGQAYGDVALGAIKAITSADFTVVRCSCMVDVLCRHWGTEKAYMNIFLISCAHATPHPGFEFSMLNCRFDQFYDLLSTKSYDNNISLWNHAAFTPGGCFLHTIRFSNAFKDSTVFKHHSAEFCESLLRDLARYSEDDEALVNLLVLFSCIIDCQVNDDIFYYPRCSHIWEALLLLGRSLSTESQSTTTLATYGQWAWWVPSPLEQVPYRLVYAFDKTSAMCSSLARLLAFFHSQKGHIKPVLDYYPQFTSSYVVDPECHYYIVQFLRAAEQSGRYVVTDAKLAQVTIRCLSFVCAPRESPAAQTSLVAVKCESLIFAAVILLVQQLYDGPKHVAPTYDLFPKSLTGGRLNRDLTAFLGSHFVRPVARGGWSGPMIRSYNNLVKLIREWRRISAATNARPGKAYILRIITNVKVTSRELWTPDNSDLYFIPNQNGDLQV